MSIKYIILALSTLVLGTSSGFVKAEPTPMNVDNAIISEDSQTLSNVPSNTVVDLLSSENNDLTTDSQMGQVNDVSRFTDVSSQDWAYDALRNLVERYNCVTPYPDGTFKGDRSLTRYEFANILDTCLQQINKLLATDTANFVKKDDLVALQKLKDDFNTELTALQQRIDKVDEKTTKLEKSQFSTTALMGGEVIFAGAQAFGGGPPGTGKSNAVFNHLTRLQLVSSFTGKDRLRIELSTGNFDGLGFANPGVLNTNTALLSYQAGYNNNIQLSNVEYRFAGLGNRAVFTIKPVGFSLSNVLSPNSPYFDTGRGAISRFAEANPIFKIGALDAGFGVDYLLNNSARLQMGYGVRNGNDPNFGAFLEKGAHAAGMQLLFLPGNDVLTGFSYIYSYSPDGRLNTFTGSAIADASGFINQPANIHAVSGTLQWRLTPKLTFATWGGLAATYAAPTHAFSVSTNFMFSLGLSDPFGRKGDLLAVMFGQQPKLVTVGKYIGANGGLVEDAGSYHIETFYRLALSDRITITPGFFLVTNPGNIDANNTIYVGAVRTTFRF